MLAYAWVTMLGDQRAPSASWRCDRTRISLGMGRPKSVLPNSLGDLERGLRPWPSGHTVSSAGGGERTDCHRLWPVACDRPPVGCGTDLWLKWLTERRLRYARSAGCLI